LTGEGFGPDTRDDDEREQLPARHDFAKTHSPWAMPFERRMHIYLCHLKANVQDVWPHKEVAVTLPS
jgi:hypothetical protein